MKFCWSVTLAWKLEQFQDISLMRWQMDEVWDETVQKPCSLKVSNLKQNVFLLISFQSAFSVSLVAWSACSLDSSPGHQKPCGELMAGIQADHWRWMTFTWENPILKAQQQSQQQLFVGICGYWENSLADSRLDFTEKSPQRTEVALEFVQSSISAIWSQPSDSDYEHTPNWCFSFMGLCFRAALCFIQRVKQPCLQFFSSESEKEHE